MERLARKELNAVPQVGDRYFYVFSNMNTHVFEMKETKCYGYESDVARIAKGNAYTDRNECKEVVKQLNERRADVRLVFAEQAVERDDSGQVTL